MKLSLNTTEFVPACEVKIPSIYFNRMRTGIHEVDEFIGGVDEDTCGILRGGVYMLAAGAGTGKSTFCLQLADALCKNGARTAFASGEEGIEQLAFSCRRLGVKCLPVAVQTNVDLLTQKMEELDLIVIDSFQTLTTNKPMSPRKKEQYCVRQLCAAAKRTHCAVLTLCHLTKAGVYKGSTTVLHAVDALINLHVDEDDNTMRVFTWGKNRFGPGDKEMVVGMGRHGYDWTRYDIPAINRSTEIILNQNNKEQSYKK
jgi:DNA repair protein RadA/Sms